MLSEERIRLMARMAAYEAGEGKENMDIGNYFRSDYISLQMIKAMISATVAFIVVLAVAVFYSFEDMMKDIYQMDFMEAGRKILLAYVIFVGVYAIIAFFYFSYRYSRARKNLKLYYTHLQELLALYESYGG